MLGKATSVSFLLRLFNLLTRLGGGTVRRGNEYHQQRSSSQIVCGRCGSTPFSVPTVRYPPVCLVDATRPRRVGSGAQPVRLSLICLPDAGRRPAHPGRTRCIQAALPENITDAGWRPAPPGKTRCVQAALLENITDAGRRPAHPGRTLRIEE